MVDYSQITKEARLKVLDLIYGAQSSHIGSNFSAIDILATLFDKANITTDEVILSAGWKAASWYYFLWKKGIITEDELNSYCQPGSKFIGLIEPMSRWGLRFAGGSMGYGLCFGVGAALSKKIKGEEGTVYVVMSDGELQCGTTWESMAIANHHRLNNLVAIVDINNLQAMGDTRKILNMGDLETKFRDFGWHIASPHDTYIDGHNYQEIERAIGLANIVLPRSKLIGQRPSAILAKTTKGKGVSFMENDNLYHYKNLSMEEYEQAKSELL